ncbi:zinc finger CCCH domain-containing protein 9-like isoform X1 [Miscanthus floridulus]|uniref:zinc finger CCCH domain-containing protein 9-like isoform X1 n=2 Tax=Miscanthus floridulus TaxID=154761 RepID=UPI00345A1F44
MVVSSSSKVSGGYTLVQGSLSKLGSCIWQLAEFSEPNAFVLQEHHFNSTCFFNSQIEATCLPWKNKPLTMQEALNSPGNASRLHSALELKLFAAFGDQRLASPPGYLNNLASVGIGGGGGDDALFRCSSPFSPSFGFSSPSPLATTSSVSLSPSSSASLVDDCDDAAAADADAVATGHRLQLARLALQYQEVADRYELCLARLADAVDEAAALHRENAELRVANADLMRRLALLSGIGKQAAAAAIADEVRRLGFGDHKHAAKECAPEKPAVLPKSISVRSSDYLKMNNPKKVQAPATPAANNHKPRASNQTNASSQRVYSKGNGGDKKGEEPKEPPHTAAAGGMELDGELEVYNQGTFKTELCNKWEETGACPYGDQCQFAHGVAELRPVIRHPRYKTQVCRMVLGGEVCSYGHRCHFRHTLTPAERLHLPRP